MRRFTSKWLLLLLLLSLVTACSSPLSSTNSPDAASKDTATPTDKGKPAAEPTIKFLVNEHPTWPTNKDWLVWKLMEKGGHMKLDLTIGKEPYPETLNLTIASGNLPDLIYMPNYLLGNKYGQQGALVNILDYLNIMPNLKKWMAENQAEAIRAVSFDGKMYVAPNKGIGETNRMLWMYRKDIFDKNGLKPPANYDQLYDVLKKLKSIYPDSYPLGLREGLTRVTNLAANFGTNADYYYDYDKKEWRYGPIENNYKVMVEYLKRFYNEGLLPPNWLSLKTDEWQQLMSKGQSFITQDYIGRIDIFNIANRQVTPEYTLINMPPPAGFPGGKQQDYSAHTLDAGYSVASTSKNKEAVLKYIDWTFSPEGRDTLSWGVKGETYKEENGAKKFIKQYGSPSDLRTETGLSLFGTYTWFDYDSHMSLFSKEVKQAYTENPKYDAPLVPKPAFNDSEQQKLAIQGESITKHRDEEIAKFILGKRDMSEWDQYVNEMKKLGVDDMLSMYTAAYKRMLDAKLK